MTYSQFPCHRQKRNPPESGSRDNAHGQAVDRLSGLSSVCRIFELPANAYPAHHMGRPTESHASNPKRCACVRGGTGLVASTHNPRLATCQPLTEKTAQQPQARTYSAQSTPAIHSWGEATHG